MSRWFHCNPIWWLWHRCLGFKYYKCVMGTEELLSSQPCSVIIMPLSKSFNLRLFQGGIVPAIGVRLVTLGKCELMYARHAVAYFSKCGVLVCCFPQCKPCREAENKTAHRHWLWPLYFSQPHIKLLHCSIYFLNNLLRLL